MTTLSIIGLILIGMFILFLMSSEIYFIYLAVNVDLRDFDVDFSDMFDEEDTLL